MAARSICVSNNAHVRPGFSIDARLCRQKKVQFRVVMKFWPTSRNHRYFHLNNSTRKFCGLGSKVSRLLCSRTEDTSSSFSTSANKDEVFSEP